MRYAIIYTVNIISGLNLTGFFTDFYDYNKVRNFLSTISSIRDSIEYFVLITNLRYMLQITYMNKV